MSRERLTEGLHASEEEGRRNEGMRSTRWLDAAKKACNARSLELRDAKKKCILSPFRAAYGAIVVIQW